MVIEYMSPVVYAGDGEWYFYDETWSDICGPYFSEYSAHQNLMKYCHIYLG